MRVKFQALIFQAIAPRPRERRALLDSAGFRRTRLSLDLLPASRSLCPSHSSASLLMSAPLWGSSGLFSLHRPLCIVRMIIQEFKSIKKVVFLISSRLNYPGRQDNFLLALAYFSIYWTLNKFILQNNFHMRISVVHSCLLSNARNTTL